MSEEPDRIDLLESKIDELVSEMQELQHRVLSGYDKLGRILRILKEAE